MLYGERAFAIVEQNGAMVGLVLAGLALAGATAYYVVRKRQTS